MFLGSNNEHCYSNLGSEVLRPEEKKSSVPYAPKSRHAIIANHFVQRYLEFSIYVYIFIDRIRALPLFHREINTKINTLKVLRHSKA